MPTIEEPIRYVYLRRVIVAQSKNGNHWRAFKYMTNYERSFTPDAELLPAGGITIAYNRARNAFGVSIHSPTDLDNPTFEKRQGRIHALARMRQGLRLFQKRKTDAVGFVGFPQGMYCNDDPLDGDCHRQWWGDVYDNVISVLVDMGVDTGGLDFYYFSHGTRSRHQI